MERRSKTKIKRKPKEFKFTIEAIKTIKDSGTVVPSSKYLIKKMLKSIKAEDKIIVEFGTGNGCITKRILEQLHPKGQLFSFELNETFYLETLQEISYDKRLHLINESAVLFDEILLKHGINKVDHIISSLPLALLNDQDVLTILQKVKKILKPDGMFVQFQYSLDKFDELKKNFSKVKLGFAAINIPPAFIYYCQT